MCFWILVVIQVSRLPPTLPSPIQFSKYFESVYSSMYFQSSSIGIIRIGRLELLKSMGFFREIRPVFTLRPSRLMIGWSGCILKKFNIQQLWRRRGPGMYLVYPSPSSKILHQKNNIDIKIWFLYFVNIKLYFNFK